VFLEHRFAMPRCLRPVYVRTEIVLLEEIAMARCRCTPHVARLRFSGPTIRSKVVHGGRRVGD